MTVKIEACHTTLKPLWKQYIYFFGKNNTCGPVCVCWCFKCWLFYIIGIDGEQTEPNRYRGGRKDHVGVAVLFLTLKKKSSPPSEKINSHFKKKNKPKLVVTIFLVVIFLGLWILEKLLVLLYPGREKFDFFSEKLLLDCAVNLRLIASTSGKMHAKLQHLR